MSTAPATRYSLLLRIQDPQNQAAWTEFVGLYEPFVYTLARRKGLQDADARDLCQDVFSAVAKAAHRWVPDPARGSFRSWLFRIAHNFAINFLRRQGPRRATGDSAWLRVLEAQAVDSNAITPADEQEYRRTLFQTAAAGIENDFTRATWQAFWQTAVEARPIEQVARDLGISSGAVYIARSRVLAKLRERVQQIEGKE